MNRGVNRAAGTVLLVEDDDQVRTFIRTLLTGEGYRVIDARTGREGLELAQQHGAEVDLLVSDMLLPELSGIDLAERIREIRPDMKVLFMTGYVEGDIVQRCTTEMAASFLDKPFLPAVLLGRVRELIGSPVKS